jgi:hypothetical protein
MVSEGHSGIQVIIHTLSRLYLLVNFRRVGVGDIYRGFEDGARYRKKQHCDYTGRKS